MKPIKKNYENMLKYENILNVFYKVKRNFNNKKAIFRYELNLNTNLYNILEKLYKREYVFSDYRIFLIKVPKYRIIMCENINDKIVNHLVSKYILLPSIESKLIDNNVATRKNKGSGYAFKKFKKYINTLKTKNEEIYILKIDIKKYFYNIDQDILIDKLKKYLKDSDSINIIKDIINLTNKDYVNKKIKEIKQEEISHIIKLNISKKEKSKKIKTINDIPLYKSKKGLPIGNMTSQILAVFYMNEIDHYIKKN